MSYILDALRKADAERERDAASDLLGTSDPDRAAPQAGPVRQVPIWLWLAVGAAIPLAALLAWRWAMPDEPAPPVVTAMSAPAAATVAPPVAQPAPASAALAADDAVRAVEADAPAPVASAPAPGAAPAAAPSPRPARKSKPAQPPTVATTAPSARAEAKPSPASAPVRPFAELPEDLRRQVPAMAIGGSVYSPQPASRMLIVNGQVMREGATLAPGLQLESIGRQSAVFSIRGQRFSMPL